MTKSGVLVVASILVVALLTLGVDAYPDCPNCGICQAHYKPVCGANGITFMNACHLGCEKACRTPGLKVAYDGECGNPVIYHH